VVLESPRRDVLDLPPPISPVGLAVSPAILRIHSNESRASLQTFVSDPPRYMTVDETVEREEELEIVSVEPMDVDLNMRDGSVVSDTRTAM
jgi:hypothetical protein